MPHEKHTAQANKWSIYELWDWFRERGEDPDPFWERTKDVIIKTILCGHKNIDTMVKESVGSFYNNYNILGFDIFMVVFNCITAMFNFQI